MDSYFSNPALNSSTIKAYIKDGIVGYNKAIAYDSKYAIESDALVKGSAVDTILTAGMEEFSKKYIVTELPPVGDKPKLIAEITIDTMVIDPNKADFNGIVDTIVIPIAREMSYRTNIKNDNIYRDWLIREVAPYYNALRKANGKTILSIEDKMYIDITVNKFINAFPHIFNNNNPNIKVYFQYPIYGELENIPIKGLLDVVVVNEFKKIVYLFDIKTTQYITSFIQTFNRMLYNVQATIYTKLATQHFNDYRVQNLTFISAGIEDKLAAQSFTCPDEILNISYNGHENYKYMSIKQAILNITKHKETNNFDIDLKYLKFKEPNKTEILFNNNHFQYDFEVAKTQ